MGRKQPPRAAGTASTRDMILGSVDIGRPFPVGAPLVGARSAGNQGSHKGCPYTTSFPVGAPLVGALRDLTGQPQGLPLHGMPMCGREGTKIPSPHHRGRGLG